MGESCNNRVVFGLWSTAVTTTEPASTNVIGTRSTPDAPIVARRATGDRAASSSNLSSVIADKCTTSAVPRGGRWTPCLR